jgi:hypothetical protein
MAGTRSGRSSSSAASEANLGACQTHEVEASTSGGGAGAVPASNRFDAEPRVRHSGSDRHLPLESHDPTEGVANRVSLIETTSGTKTKTGVSFAEQDRPT